MVKGKKCPACGHKMVTISEKDVPKGSWIVYECSSCRFMEIIFESKQN